MCESAADGSWSARCLTGLSYGSHTVGFTPPATLSRAAISHYNTPALHVHGGSSHAVAVSTTHTADSSHKKFFTCKLFFLIGAILRQMLNEIYHSGCIRHTCLLRMKCSNFGFLHGHDFFNCFISIVQSRYAASSKGHLVCLFCFVHFASLIYTYTYIF